jgi:hypothetical protein
MSVFSIRLKNIQIGSISVPLYRRMGACAPKEDKVARTPNI